MSLRALSQWGVGLALACSALVPAAQADSQVVSFDRLEATATVKPVLGVGDTLFLDTLVTQEIGALDQTITFTVGPGVSTFSGMAAWAVSPPAGSGPRLVGVNIDILDSTNTVIASDTFVGLLGGFAHSTFSGSIGPGIYKMHATGTGIRASSLDASLTFAIPEPETYAMLLVGVGLVGFAVQRARRR